MPDHRVLDLLAREMGLDLGIRDPESALAELDHFGPWTGRRPAVDAPGDLTPDGGAPAGGDGLLLATWPLLLDRGRMQDGEPFLAGTARRTTALLSPATAKELGVERGAQVTITGDRGSVTVPLEIAEMPDGVVWLPTNSAGCAVRRDVAAGTGARVTVVAVGPDEGASADDAASTVEEASS
jgi:NADH-quinone oxidoreductase subunit G